ncbi:YvcK family protein [Candidatus Shapirobacteria bacterium]|nr:YvcK family protein [Candidatus Shapirobacteria bacterium]
MDKKRLICTIGGGTGMPVVNEALVKAGYSNIHSIVTTFDNGGDTGRMRTDERGMFLANSDFWRALISLWNDGSQKEIWMEMLRYRDGRERSFGNTFFQFMTEKTGSLDKVDNLFKSLTLADLKGRVIPVSLSPANLYFETISGKKYSGEKFLDQLRMSCDYIKKIWLEPRVKAHPEAIKTLENAEMLIVCPGSVYGSLMVNFLIDDFKKSFQKSHAKKILMVNLMTQANEGKICDQLAYADLFKKQLGIDFDHIVMADLSVLNQRKLNKLRSYYGMEHSNEVSYKVDKSKKTILEDLATIDEKNWRLRHSTLKLAHFFAKMNHVSKEVKRK